MNSQKQWYVEAAICLKGRGVGMGWGGGGDIGTDLSGHNEGVDGCQLRWIIFSYIRVNKEL